MCLVLFNNPNYGRNIQNKQGLAIGHTMRTRKEFFLFLCSCPFSSLSLSLSLSRFLFLFLFLFLSLFRER